MAGGSGMIRKIKEGMVSDKVTERILWLTLAGALVESRAIVD